MPKDDSGKGKAPPPGEEQVPETPSDAAKPGEGDAPTVVLTVPPHLMAGQDEAEGGPTEITHDAPTAVMVEPPADYFEEGGEGESETVMLVDPEAAMRAAEEALQSEGTEAARLDTAGAAEEDATPPVMWINPKKKKPEAEEEAPAEEDAATQVLTDPMAMVEEWRAQQEAAVSGEVEEAASQTGEEAAEAMVGAMGLDAPLEEREAATVMVEEGAEAEPSEEPPPPPTEPPTVFLERPAEEPAMTAEEEDAGTIEMEAQLGPIDEEAVEDDGSTVEMEAQLGPIDEEEAEVEGEAPTIMMEAPPGPEEEEAAQIEDEERSIDEAFETVMLSAGPMEGDLEEEEEEGLAETVALEVHEAQISEELEAVAAGVAEEGAEPVKMGAAAEPEALFADPYATVRVGEDEEVDLVSDPRMPRVGEMIAERYEITRLIGQGGFAAVFEATDEAISGKVAVKVLQAEKSVDPDFAKRFKQEVLVVRQLQHPNSIKITDTGTTERGCLFMVMEFADGIPLDDFIKKHGALDPARTVRISEQILKALAEAHEKGIIHRDLKPPNIMLTEAGGEDDFVKVLDFGIAKALEPDLTQVQTKTGIIFCTPRYAPPEILTGRKISAAADVYALGLMMSEMLSGKAVVATPSDAEAIAYQLSPEDVPIPPEIVETPLGKVVKKATAKKAEDRYQDASEMLAALRKIGQAHLPTVPLLITSVNPIETGQIQFDSTLQFLEQARDAATLRVGAETRAAAVERPTRWGSVAAVLAALAAAVLIVVMLAWPSGPEGPEEATETVVTPPEGPEQPETPVVETPRGPTARQILATRLAASDWEAGSWIELPPEQRPRVRRPRVVTTGTGEGTGEEVAALEPIYEIALIEGTGVGTGVGTGEGTGLAILPIEMYVIEPSVDAKAEAARLALLYESAQSTARALDVLKAALDEGDVAAEETSLVTEEMLFLTGQMVTILSQLDRCDAAERRLEEAVGGAQVVSPDGQQTVSDMQAEIGACRERVAARQEVWDPTDYLVQVAEGDRLEEEAAAVPPEDDEARRALLYQSVHARQEAIGMLQAALEAGTIPGQHRQAAGRDLALLNDQVTAMLLDLELSVAAEVQIEETAESAELLDQESQQDLAVLVTAFEEDGQVQAEQEAAERARLRAQAEAAEGTGAEVAVLEVTPGEGTAEGTGVTVAEVEAVPEAGAGWDWRGQYASLVQTSADLFEQAQEIEVEEAPAGPLPCQLPEECGEGMTCVEGECIALADYIPPCTVDEDCEGEWVCVDGFCAEPQAPPVYSRLVRITTDPDRVSVVLEGETIGRTPFEQVIESEQTEISLRLRRADYDSERVTVVLTEEGTFERSIELQLRNPFGQTTTIAGEFRSRHR